MPELDEPTPYRDPILLPGSDDPIVAELAADLAELGHGHELGARPRPTLVDEALLSAVAELGVEEDDTVRELDKRAIGPATWAAVRERKPEPKPKRTPRKRTRRR